MNSIQKLLICLLVSFIVIGYGCKKDDPVGCSDWAADVQTEANAFTAALNTYSLDPTTANCQAFKDAGQEYLNALESHADCATAAGQGAELQSYIDQSRASIDAIQC